MNKIEFNTHWSSLHGGAEVKGIVKAWLAISYRSAKVATILRISPNLLTISGVIFAMAMALNPLSIWCIPLLVISLFADGIDGSVAIVQGKASPWGAVLDAVADRISEALWFYVAYEIGAPAWVVLGGGPRHPVGAGRNRRVGLCSPAPLCRPRLRQWKRRGPGADGVEGAEGPAGKEAAVPSSDVGRK